jgi:hypothetical protein
MALLPSKGMMIFSENNVNITAGTKADAAYDLALYEELGKPTRGVLVVTIIFNFKFKDGVSKKPATKGAKLVWAPQEKTDFMDGVKTVCASVWGEKHRLTTTNSIPAAKDVGVIFDVQTAENMSITTHSHWNVTTERVDDWTSSQVGDCGGWFTNGESDLDSQDLDAVDKGGPDKQRGAVHEFGHMLGYRDEYPSAKPASNPNPNWPTDLVSIMHSGETVQPRHYIFFADWIGRQWQARTTLYKFPDWKVNGTVDMTTARI